MNTQPTNKEAVIDINLLRTGGEWDNNLHDGNVNCGGMKVADCNSMFISKQTADANAKYICLAVNSHEALLDIAKRALFMFQNEANYPEGTNGYRLAQSAKEAINKCTL